MRRGWACGWIMLGGLLVLSAPRANADVRVRKDARGHWQLLVDGEPYVVRGVTYRVTKVGESPDTGTLKDWAWYDHNGNGRSDGPYDAWVDRNGNHRQDGDEPAVGDFALLRDMGVNTIRWYMNDFKRQSPRKALLRDLVRTYGIRVAVGNKFGAYTIDSGASWSEGTDYRNPEQQARMLESVRRMVLDHKDEPYLLLWLLGNENNLRFTNTNAAEDPEAYARFLNRAAELIHELDGRHPVALVNGDAHFLNEYRRLSPRIDIFGVNAYRGPDGFGGLWVEVREQLDRPVLITEYGGSDAAGSNEEAQAAYHRGCWLDIAANLAGRGEGNSLGGLAYSWLDEWWKAGDPAVHAPVGATGRQGVGAVTWDQEYCGLAGQGDGSASPFLRRLRRVYWTYRELWVPFQF
ncbi:MAG TPA: glycoside hydrolase family 2 TIM barrel-domain containing protein [bacterium]